MSVGASGAAAAAAARAKAIRASGTIVAVDSQEFLTILERHSEPLVIKAVGGVFTTTHRYLTSYKGLAFYTQSRSPLELPTHCEIISAQKIWIPG